MQCPQCGELLRPVPKSDRETLVAVPFIPGHDHNDNCLCRQYQCANGHRIGFWLRRRCPACDWKGKLTCFCHEHVQPIKLDRWPEDDLPEQPATGGNFVTKEWLHGG